MSHLNYLSEFSTKRVHVYQCAHTNDAALDADCGRTSCRLCKNLIRLVAITVSTDALSVVVQMKFTSVPRTLKMCETAYCHVMGLAFSALYTLVPRFPALHFLRCRDFRSRPQRVMPCQRLPSLVSTRS